MRVDFSENVVGFFSCGGLIFQLVRVDISEIGDEIFGFGGGVFYLDGTNVS